MCVCGFVCDLKTSRMRRPGPELGCGDTRKTTVISMCMYIYRIYSLNSRTFLTKILYLNLGCVIYARKRFYVNKSGYTGSFLNIVLKA